MPEELPSDRKVVRAAIHPSIGIARVGNSEEEFFIGPEVDDPAPFESAKDPSGALKRQAARFRVYGYNAAGEVVSELTAEEAEVEWTVHVANKKAAWYQFQIALDIPEAKDPSSKPSALRNQQAADREELAIDPGPRTIAGADLSGTAYRFDTGEFMGRKVYLGELRTDPEGRLLFLGGRGASASPDNVPINEFANNDGWHDDVADGPVTAQVRIDGESIPVDPAWVIVGPPNYGPDLVSVRTMYDLLYDVYVQAGWLPKPQRVSFSEHVYPLLRRLSELQWVNYGFATKFGWQGQENFLDPDYLVQLASSAKQHEELRREVWNTFRTWSRDGMSPVPWPWIYGDAMSRKAISPRQFMMLTETQMWMLECWAKGEFDADLDLDAEPPRSLEEVPLGDQPAMLDRAALHFCLADAFHPGCEMTWPVRHLSMYMAPFRLLHRADDDPEPALGEVLTPEAALSQDGPLYGQSPGSITRWMAVPWQTDTASCLSGYDLSYDPYLPTFWPARVPNHVLAQEDYEIVMDDTQPLEARLEAFERRAYWLRWLSSNHEQSRAEMIEKFGLFGVVEARPGPGEGWPETILVESEVGFEGKVNPRRNLYTLHVPEAQGQEVAEGVLAEALDAVDLPSEEVMVGYFDNIERFEQAEE
jgi:L-lysine epsilon oxidase-like protein